VKVISAVLKLSRTFTNFFVWFVSARKAALKLLPFKCLNIMVSGALIERGTIILRGGLIDLVGANVKIFFC